MTNTIPNVPRELLADLLGNDHDKRIMAERHLLAMLANAPSPAGVDGCRCSMSISVLGDGCRYCQHQEYIDRLSEMLDEERAELSAAQAIIDGLRGEVEVMTQHANNYSRMFEECAEERDKQAQRIGELEGLLRSSRKHVAYAADHCEQAGMELDSIDAALSAGKDSD